MLKKARKFATGSLAFASCLLLTSCGGLSTAKNFAKKSVGSVAKLIPSRIPIAEVRKEDLKKMPTGADRAMAWERHLDRKRYAFTSLPYIPGNYKPPTLPDQRTLPTDGNILPPLNRDAAE